MRHAGTSASLTDLGILLPVRQGIGGYLPAIKRSVASHAGKKSPIASLTALDFSQGSGLRCVCRLLTAAGMGLRSMMERT